MKPLKFMKLAVIAGDDESVGAWNARLQQLMRAAQTLGPGTSQFIINAANPIYDDDGDGPFGISGRLDDEDLSPDDDESDEPHDSDDEIYVEEEDDMEDARDAWRSLRTAGLVPIGWFQFRTEFMNYLF